MNGCGGRCCCGCAAELRSKPASTNKKIERRSITVRCDKYCQTSADGRNLFQEIIPKQGGYTQCATTPLFQYNINVFIKCFYNINVSYGPGDTLGGVGDAAMDPAGYIGSTSASPTACREHGHRHAPTRPKKKPPRRECSEVGACPAHVRAYVHTTSFYLASHLSG